jgi:hypothetical protein
MKGISTRYSSSFEWKKAQAWQGRLRTDPARHTGSLVAVMRFSFVPGDGTQPLYDTPEQSGLNAHQTEIVTAPATAGQIPASGR